MKYFICFSILLSSLYGEGFKEGIELIKQRQYAQAAEQFQEASKAGNSAALFGEVICEVALGKHEKVHRHLQQFEQIACASCQEEQEPTTPLMTEEIQVSAYDCRQRVRKVTKALRSLVEKMVADTVPGFLKKIKTFRQLNPYIDMLERNGLACCEKSQNSEQCTEPLEEQLKLWHTSGLPEPEQE